MKSIYRGTTPLIKFTHPFDYQYITKLSVTFTQDGKEIIKIKLGDSELYSIENGLVVVELTEEETNKFKHNFPVDAQLKIKNLDGEIWVSDVEHYTVHRILDTESFN